MLFSHDEYDDAFRDTGCAVTQVPDWPVGRGRYVGVGERNAQCRPAWLCLYRWWRR